MPSLVVIGPQIKEKHRGGTRPSLNRVKLPVYIRSLNFCHSGSKHKHAQNIICIILLKILLNSDQFFCH